VGFVSKAISIQKEQRRERKGRKVEGKKRRKKKMD
jgi:hypothetical protein